VKSDGSVLDVEISSSVVDGETGLVQSIVRDITERKSREEALARRLMKFRLDEGNVYLAKESVPTISREAFDDLLSAGARGIVISRSHRDELEKTIHGDFEFFWLSERGGEGTICPDMEAMVNKIESIPGKSAVLVDRLDYLVTRCGFEDVLAFVQNLSELAFLNNLITVLSIDASTLDGRQLALLGKESMKIESREAVRISPDKLRILKYVYRQNLLDVKPSYGDIVKELGISYPTVSKKINFLISGGYIRETRKGSRKMTELTELGSSLIMA
jgi:DNA-binding MarR family transcriptional regulator